MIYIVPFTLNLPTSFYLKWVSWRQQIVGSCFQPTTPVFNLVNLDHQHLMKSLVCYGSSLPFYFCMFCLFCFFASHSFFLPSCGLLEHSLKFHFNLSIVFWGVSHFGTIFILVLSRDLCAKYDVTTHIKEARDYSYSIKIFKNSVVLMCLAGRENSVRKDS